uniref:UDP-glucuronosyltransferase n=1 Tax=Panagrolaimus davidi TaxID=227884 RepID=A0A914NZ54_9BILA
MKKLFIIFLCIHFIHSLNILVYQTLPGSSHIAFSGKIVDILVQAGHTVDKLIIEWNPNVLSNGTTLARRIKRFGLNTNSPWLSATHVVKPFDNVYYHPFDDEPVFYRKTLSQFCEAMVEDESLLEWIKEGKYDSVLSSAYDACGHGLFHLAEIKPVMIYSPTNLIDHWALMLGIPAMASYVPNPLRNNGQGDKMSLTQKISALADRTYQQQIVLPSYHEVQNSIFQRKFGPSFPSLTELAKQSSMVFVNSHPLLELGRPYSHKIQQIGGITLKESSGKLSNEFEEILNDRYKGAIVFSFGSLAKTDQIPIKIHEIFAKAFNNFPQYTVIWKFDGENTEFMSNYSNIYPVKWIQQIELLNDPRVKLFISHTGLNSLLESAHSGTPVLSIPLFLDQNYNAHVVESRGVGLKLLKSEITVASLTDAIQKILTNESFSENAKNLQKMLKNFPNKSEKTLINWIEYVSSFKDYGNHIQLQSANMSTFEYFCGDIFFVLFFASFSLFYLLYSILKYFHFLLKQKLKIE